MGDRRQGRGPWRRTDKELVTNDAVMLLLDAVAAGRVTRQGTRANAPFLLGEVRVELRSLARDDLVYAPFGGAAPPALAPRGQRLLAAWRGELPLPLDY